MKVGELFTDVVPPVVDLAACGAFADRVTRSVAA